MTKNTNLCVDLKTVLQNDAQVAEGKCYNGTLSRTDDEHYLFEESVTTSRQRRNPKVFDGQYLSMVHKPDGQYQYHFKSMPDLTRIDRDTLALGIYKEVVTALSIIPTNYQA